MTQVQMLLYVLAAALVLFGLLGIVLPALPGLPLVFAGLLIAAWADGFVHVHWGWMIALGLLTAVSLVVDFWATGVGAKRVGASSMATWGAVLGSVVGIFFGLPGLFVGPFVGAVLGELLHRRRLGRDDLGQATRIGFGTWLGLALGIGLKVALAGLMLGLFALAWIF